MKKVFIIAAIGLSLTSCEKIEKETCNCGYITNDQITFDANGNACYSLTIRNSCTDNLKTWCFSQDVWMDANVGENFCVTNVDSW